MGFVDTEKVVGSLTLGSLVVKQHRGLRSMGIIRSWIGPEGKMVLAMEVVDSLAFGCWNSLHYWLQIKTVLGHAVLEVKADAAWPSFPNWVQASLTGFLNDFTPPCTDEWGSSTSLSLCSLLVQTLAPFFLLLRLETCRKSRSCRHSLTEELPGRPYPCSSQRFVTALDGATSGSSSALCKFHFVAVRSYSLSCSKSHSRSWCFL